MPSSEEKVSEASGRPLSPAALLPFFSRSVSVRGPTQSGPASLAFLPHLPHRTPRPSESAVCPQEGHQERCPRLVRAESAAVAPASILRNTLT